MMFWLWWCGLWLLASAVEAFAVHTSKIHFDTARRQAYDYSNEESLYGDDEELGPRRRRSYQPETKKDMYYREPLDSMRTPPPVDYYYEDEEDYYEDRRRRPQPREDPTAAASSTTIASTTDPMTPPLDRSEQYRDSFYEEYEEEEEDTPPSGNYWSNPTQTVDRIPSTKRRPANRRPRSIPRRDYRPPHAALELYQRFFWYGIEDDDDDRLDDSDRTLFGGTKGKFNGLSYLGKDLDTRVRRRPRRDDDSWDDEPMRTDKNQNPEAPRRGPQERKFQNDDYYNDPGRNRFDEDDTPRRPYSGRRRDFTPPRDEPTPILYGMFEAFFGAREDPIAAARYDEIIRGKPRPSRQRPGYAYPYEQRHQTSNNYEEKGIPRYNRQQQLYDEELYDEETDRRREKSFSRYGVEEEEYSEEIVIDTETLPVEESVSTETNNTRTLQNAPSWEERALAMERVPPDTIPAWGPTGELGMNAREKAVQDALEDLKMAEATLRDLERKYRDAKEEIAILRVDAELERRRLRESDRLSPRQINEQLRRLDRKVEDASRASRLQQQRLDAAKQEEEDLKSRHWAVLRCYDPDLASQAVSEAVKESSEKLNLGEISAMDHMGEATQQ